jgi:hypothetical protein
LERIIRRRAGVLGRVLDDRGSTEPRLSWRTSSMQTSIFPARYIQRANGPPGL